MYVQKLHFLTFLCFGTTLVAFLASIAINLYAGLILMGVGLSFSYLGTLRKQAFILPDKLQVTRSIAKRLSTPDLSPKAAAIVATQMYYVLRDLERSEILLNAYLNGTEPLVHTTLADIYLQQGRNEEALACLKPVVSQEHPIVHWMFGRAFLTKMDFPCALKHLEQAWRLTATKGLPVAGTGVLNNLFMQWSIKSSLLHSIADCYHRLGNKEQAQRHRRLGNRYLLDPGFRCQEQSYETSMC